MCFNTLGRECLDDVTADEPEAPVTKTLIAQQSPHTFGHAVTSAWVLGHWMQSWIVPTTPAGRLWCIHPTYLIEHMRVVGEGHESMTYPGRHV